MPLHQLSSESDSKRAYTKSQFLVKRNIGRDHGGTAAQAMGKGLIRGKVSAKFIKIEKADPTGGTESAGRRADWLDL